MHISEIAKDA